MRCNRRHGFTLVEVIVVLVILAILAAIMIPSMVGYIDKADTEKCRVTALGIKRLYQAGAAYMAYETDKIDTAALLKDAASEYVDAVQDAGYTCPGGGACSVGFSADKCSIDSITCDKHGAMISGTQKVYTTKDYLEGLGSAASNQTFSFDSSQLYSVGSNVSKLKTARENILAALPSEMQETLKGKSWTVNVKGYNVDAIYFYDGELTEADYDKYYYKEKMTVSKWDAASGTISEVERNVRSTTINGVTKYIINADE